MLNGAISGFQRHIYVCGSDKERKTKFLLQTDSTSIFAVQNNMENLLYKMTWKSWLWIYKTRDVILYIRSSKMLGLTGVSTNGGAGGGYLF